MTLSSKDVIRCTCSGLLLALSGVHCGAQNFDAIGGTADIDWPPAPIASEAYDPERSCGQLLIRSPRRRARAALAAL